jgi:putative phosphoesterase
MKLAIISDIHSNSYALKAVVDDIRQQNISKVIVLGDIFGYYPWAVETFDLLSRLPLVAICGNHDQLVLTKESPEPIPAYWPAAQDNAQKLSLLRPQALDWLKNLACQAKVTIEGKDILLCHGTPDNPCEGRLYPDDKTEHAWFPLNNQVLLLGHTHYPFLKRTKGGGLIINPGSVGQPRDGNPDSSWCILETEDLSCIWKRTKYNYMDAAGELGRMRWEELSIRALKKNYQGPLR